MEDTGSATILLVEDDALLRQAFRLLLEDAGYRCREAGSAAETLRLIDEEIPSLVLLDLGLPDLPGLELTRRLREDARTADIPVVALTGRAGEHERRACLEAGCTHYFAKPLSPNELLRWLPELLAGRDMSST
ncbi:MAG TPA: response regulator [Longimicrobiales bacterium]|nr:response regulator [Longimicrobiales bacterium]